MLRARYGPDLVDHHTFVICSDGDLMEGISHEAASLAGHLGLGRLIYVYDDNHITIDGPTEIALTDDAVKRFDAYGWHTEDLGEVANDTDALEAALRRAMAVEDRPSFLLLRSHIGWPAPHMTDNPKAHGDPLGAEEVTATKEILGLPPDESVLGARRGARYVPRRPAPAGARAGRLGQALAEKPAPGREPATAHDWDAQWSGHGHAGLASRSCRPGQAGREGRHQGRPEVDASTPSCADVPGLVSGGADLTGNTGTKLDGEPPAVRGAPGGPGHRVTASASTAWAGS